MRTYYVTVASHEAAIAINPFAEHLATLPACLCYGHRCCGTPFIGAVPERYVYRVVVLRRRDAERAPGVIRCRATEARSYKTSVHYTIC